SVVRTSRRWVHATAVVNTEHCCHDTAHFLPVPFRRRNLSLDVGVRLQSIRKMKGLSQRDLAERAGVTTSTISMIDENSVSPSIRSLKKVLSGIPMSLVEFFSLDLQEENRTQVVYKADELMDIGGGSVAMRLIGKAFPNRALSMLDETYPPNS